MLVSLTDTLRLTGQRMSPTRCLQVYGAMLALCFLVYHQESPWSCTHSEIHYLWPPDVGKCEIESMEVTLGICKSQDWYEYWDGTGGDIQEAV